METTVDDRLGSVEPGLLGRLRGSLLAGFERSVPADLLWVFRAFFAGHLFLQTLKLFWGEPGWVMPAAISVLVLAAAVLAATRDLFHLGLLSLLAYKLHAIVDDFPMTSNHAFFEAMVLVLLLIFSQRRPAGGPGGGPTDGLEALGCHLIQVLMLTTYFFGGLQKLVHGMWLNGEYAALNLFIDFPYGMPVSVQKGYAAMAALFDGGAPALPFAGPSQLGAAAFDFPAWAVGLCVALGWLVVIGELAAPLMVASRRFHPLGLWVLLAVQLGIAVFAWETEFMFATVACLMLYYHRRPVRNFGILLAVHAAWSISVALLGLRISTL